MEGGTVVRRGRGRERGGSGGGDHNGISTFPFKSEGVILLSRECFFLIIWQHRHTQTIKS